MAWEIVEELMIGSTKYTWNFPSELKNIILSEIEDYGNPNFSIEITSQIPNHSMHDWTIVDYPFTFHKGSDGNWQGGTSYTIGLGTYSIPSRDSDGIYYELTNNHRAGVSYISNTNGTMVVFFAINETAHQAAIMHLMSAWYLSGDMNRISLTGSGTVVTDYEQFYSDLISAIPSNYTSNGGGATHIAKVTGQLKDLSSNLSDILIVSGGGGGGLLVGETSYTGKEAGGISGSGDNSADQTTGNAFGLGESGTNLSGGGSGLYGGYKGTSSKSGGAGSGYIGNSLLSNKKMVGYNVPTSSAESTKTESVNDVSASAVSGKPKSGNGFARIKFLRDILIRVLVDSLTEYLDSNLTETRMVEQGSGYTKGGGGGFSQGLFGIGSNYGAQVGFGYVTDLIDFSLYSKIKLVDCRYTLANNNSFKIVLVRDEPIWKIQNQSPWGSLNKITDFTATNKSSSQDYVFDISSITESGYLIFGCPNMEVENSFSVEFQKLELIE